MLIGLQFRRPDSKHFSLFFASIIALTSQIPPPTTMAAPTNRKIPTLRRCPYGLRCTARGRRGLFGELRLTIIAAMTMANRELLRDLLPHIEIILVITRACLQLGGLCTRTDQNQTRNAVLFCSAAGTLGIPKSVVEGLMRGRLCGGPTHA